MKSYIYKTKYYGNLLPNILNFETILTNNLNEIEKIPIKIIFYDQNLSIRNFIESDFIDTYKQERSISNVYIFANSLLDLDSINSILDKIILLNEHSSFKLKTYPQSLIYVPQTIYKNTTDAINLNDGIIMHFTKYIDSDYTYIDLQSYCNSNIIPTNYIEYIHFTKRNYVNLLHGIVKSDGSVEVFNAYPLENTTKIFILDNSWRIVHSTKNKIALKQINNLYIWMVSLYDSFISHSENIANDDILEASLLDTNMLDISEIKQLMKIYNNIGFMDLNFTEKNISAEDKKNNILAFSGILSELELGLYYNIFKYYM
uniref:Uncharacterized protein n=1 Tax=Faxonius propinquus nudivirus TaxID=3139431 RepID=A0AAU8GF28_9VIRU